MTFSKFIFGDTLEQAIEAIPEEHQLRFYRYVKNYGLHGEEPELTGFELATWVQMKALIERTIPKKNNTSPIGKVGAPFGNANATKPKNNSENNSNNSDNCFEMNSQNNYENNSPNVNDNVNDNDNDNSGANAPCGSDEPCLSRIDALELAMTFLETHRAEIPDYLAGKDDKKTVERWAEDIEKLIRIDKKPPETIRQVIIWVKTPGNFWFHNIESGKKLREKFERLYGEMQSKQKGTGPPLRRISADHVPKENIASYFTEAAL